MQRASDFRDDGSRERRRQLRRALLRPVFTVALFVAAYFVLPWTSFGGTSTLMLLVGGLVVVVAVGFWQVLRIMRSDAPALQAVEALAVILPVYLLGFSASYFLMSESDPHVFSEQLSRVGALYFTLAVFSTVGFGDIAATTDASRAVVSAQIFGNLVLIGVGIRVVTAAVGWARKRKQ